MEQKSQIGGRFHEQKQDCLTELELKIKESAQLILGQWRPEHRQLTQWQRPPQAPDTKGPGLAGDRSRQETGSPPLAQNQSPCSPEQGRCVQGSLPLPEHQGVLPAVLEPSRARVSATAVSVDPADEELMLADAPSWT